LRILLVEDDQMNIELFESALETDGHEIVTEREARPERSAPPMGSIWSSSTSSSPR
jgi:CheY-like chemotaxis protein